MDKNDKINNNNIDFIKKEDNKDIKVEYLKSIDNNEKIQRLLKYKKLFNDYKISEQERQEMRKKRIKRRLKLLKDRYENQNLDELEIETYKSAGCNNREDVLKLEILYIKSSLEKMNKNSDIVETLKRLNNIEDSISEEPLNKERYNLIKKNLVIIEILYDLDVGLVSVIDDLYDEYALDNDKVRSLK